MPGSVFRPTFPGQYEQWGDIGTGRYRDPLSGQFIGAPAKLGTLLMQVGQITESNAAEVMAYIRRGMERLPAELKAAADIEIAAIAEDLKHNLKKEIAWHSEYSGTGPSHVHTLDTVEVKPISRFEGVYDVVAGGAAAILETGTRDQENWYTIEPKGSYRLHLDPPSRYTGRTWAWWVMHPPLEAYHIVEKAMAKTDVIARLSALATRGFVSSFPNPGPLGYLSPLPEEGTISESSLGAWSMSGRSRPIITPGSTNAVSAAWNLAGTELP